MDLAAGLAGPVRATRVDARPIGRQTLCQLAQVRSRSTDSPAVTATGTMFAAASTSGMSSNAARRQHERISAPVKSRSLGRFWLASSPNLSR